MSTPPQSNGDGATSSLLARRDGAAILHPYSDAVSTSANGPLVLTQGNGIYVTDENGNTYIEGMSGLWCVSLGFGNTRLANAATQQIQKLSFYHGFNQKGHDANIELAERLLKAAPVPMARVFFANSGSEANDTAVKLIWYFNNALGRTKKKKIIGRIKGYHGVTIASGSITGTPINHTSFDLPLDRFLHTDFPHYARESNPGETEEAFASRCAENLERLIIREGPETIAAFFAEPVMGAGGIIMPPKGYFEKIQTVLKKYNILMVADEVITGFGRTGNYWGSQTFGVAPDILTCAKALSSGYIPISAVLISHEIFQTVAQKSRDLEVFGHGFTYSGHPVSAAVALETLKIYEEMDILGHVKKIAPLLKKGIDSFGDHPIVGEVSAVGLLAVAELVSDKTSLKPFPPEKKVGAYLIQKALGQGLILRNFGDRIGFCPPLIINPDEISELFVRFGKALDETMDWAKNRG